MITMFILHCILYCPTIQRFFFCCCCSTNAYLWIHNHIYIPFVRNFCFQSFKRMLFLFFWFVYFSYQIQTDSQCLHLMHVTCYIFFLRNFLIKTAVIAKMLFKSPTATTKLRQTEKKRKNYELGKKMFRSFYIYVKQYCCWAPKFDGVRTFSVNSLGKTRILTLEIPFGWFLDFEFLPVTHI